MIIRYLIALCLLLPTFALAGGVKLDLKLHEPEEPTDFQLFPRRRLNEAELLAEAKWIQKFCSEKPEHRFCVLEREMAALREARESQKENK
jgi:hypothetical protein